MSLLLLFRPSVVVAGDVTVVSPPAIGTASALTPTLIVRVDPTFALATASALTPTLTLAVAPAPATATASGLTPTLRVVAIAPFALATASGRVPTLILTIAPSPASATASGLVPLIIVPQPPVVVLVPVAIATALAPVRKLSISAQYHVPGERSRRKYVRPRV